MSRRPPASLPAGKAGKPAARPPPPPARRAPPQFALIGLFTVMLVCSFASAGAYYLVRSMQGDSDSQLVGILLLLAGPMLLMIVISLLIALARWWRG